MTLEQKLDQESADHRKTQQSADEQRNTLKRINDKLHDDLDKEIAKREREHKQATLELENKYNLQVVALNNKLQQAAKESNLAVSRTKQEYDEKLHEANRVRTEVERRLELSDKARQEALGTIRDLEQTQQRTRTEITTISETLRKVQKHVQDSEAQVKGLKEDKEGLQSMVDKLKTENQESKTKLQDQTWKVKDAEDKLRKAEASGKTATEGKEKELKSLKEKLRAAEKSTEEKQTELDDLFVILGDLEEKRSKDKVCPNCPLSHDTHVLTFHRNASKSSVKKCRMEKTTTMMMRTTKTRMKTTSRTVSPRCKGSCIITLEH
jgi:chromosome segregation ATPase